jgi:hypothetical protein
VTAYNTTFHLTGDAVTSAHAHSVVTSNHEANWLSIRIGKGEMTIFAPDLATLAVIGKQITLAVDTAIRDRYTADNDDRPSVVDELVADDEGAEVYDIGGPWTQDA